MVRELWLGVADWMGPIALMLAGAWLFCSLATGLTSAIVLSAMGALAGRLTAKLFGW